MTYLRIDTLPLLVTRQNPNDPSEKKRDHATGHACDHASDHCP